jgi:hypothetical protein
MLDTGSRTRCKHAPQACAARVNAPKNLALRSLRHGADAKSKEIKPRAKVEGAREESETICEVWWEFE